MGAVGEKPAVVWAWFVARYFPGSPRSCKTCVYDLESKRGEMCRLNPHFTDEEINNLNRELQHGDARLQGACSQAHL